MQLINQLQTRTKQLVIFSIVITMIASGVFIPRAFGAGGGPPSCENGIPGVSFSLQPATKGVGTLEVSLDGQYSDPCDDPIVDYAWNFGDGSTAHGVSVTHIYGVGTFRPTLTITDASGATNTATYRNDIVVKATNQNPIFNDSSYETFHQNYLDIDLKPLASDPDGDNINDSYYLVDASSNHVKTDKGYISLNSYAGTLRYSAINYNPTGQDIINIGIKDGFGGTDTAQITINLHSYVTGVDDTATTYSGTPVTINVAANDYSYYGEAVTVARYAYEQTNGTATVNADGTITFVPAAGFVGTGSFRYVIYSSNPAMNAVNHAYAYIDVRPVPNYAPVAVNDNLNVGEDSSGTINVLANDSDQDGDALSSNITTGPVNGTASMSPAGLLSYTPNANFYGTDTVQYQVTDSKGAASTATVIIGVSSINDVPASSNDTASIAEDNNVSIAVLSNDSDVEDGTNLTVQIVSNPAHGTATVNSDKTITYAPKANFNGNDSFTYKVTDKNGATSTSTVNITVTSVNDGPTAAFTGTLKRNGTATLNASTSHDIDGQIASYTWNFGDGQTATTTSPTTDHRYTGKNSSYQVTLTVTDNQGATATIVRTIAY